MPLSAIWMALSTLMAGWVLLSFWPTHTLSVLGWFVLLVGVWPAALLGKYRGDRLIFRNRLGTRGAGLGASAIRITYVLLCIIGLELCLLLLICLSRIGWASAL